MSKNKRWTAEEIELLRRLYPSHPTEDIACRFNTSISAITAKAFKCGIRKNPEVLAENRKKGWFRKGHAPFNKGMKREDYMSDEGLRNSAKTQFVRGHKPHNTRPMYSERINKDGYIEIKVPERKGFVQKHRWIWERHHGAIPKDCQIHFIDSNPQNCDISNLEIITQKENALRNCPWRKYPKEVASLFQLNGALSRQINKNKSNQ